MTKGKVVQDFARLVAKRSSDPSLDKVLRSLEKIEENFGEVPTSSEKPLKRPYSSDPDAVTELWN